MEGMLEGMLGAIFGLQDELLQVLKTVTLLPFAVFSNKGTSSVAGIVSGLSDGLQSTGVTLLIFFFFYEFLKKTVMFEFVNWENVVKILLRFIIAKVLVQNCHVVLQAIAIVINGIIGILGSPEQMEQMIDAAQKAEILEEFGQKDFFASIFFFLQYGLAWIVMMIVRAVVLVVVYGRFIEIGIYTAIAPIPLATIAGESTSSVAKKFIQSYIGVLLQGVIIVVMCFIYVGLVIGLLVDGDFIQYILCSLVLLFTVAKSGNWAKQIMGA